MDLRYTTELPTKENLYTLYNDLGWNDFLKLSPEQVVRKQSWYSIYVYSEKKVVTTGRIVSDGIINAYLCWNFPLLTCTIYILPPNPYYFSSEPQYVIRTILSTCLERIIMMTLQAGCSLAAGYLSKKDKRQF